MIQSKHLPCKYPTKKRSPLNTINDSEDRTGSAQMVFIAANERLIWTLMSS
jgi:hypothetical protein